jgi:3-dehydroquinate synthetase
MLSDKKRGSGGLTLVVPEEIGRCVLKTMSLDEVREMLRLGLSA